MHTLINHCLSIHRYRNTLILCLLWLGLSFEAYAGLYAEPIPQSALVIGNIQYEVGKLSDSVNVNNAAGIAIALENVGFEVIFKTNLTRIQMYDAVREFKNDLVAKKGAGLFYFSGYGAQVKGKNYLLPIDNAHIKYEDYITHEAISVAHVLDEMQNSHNDLNIIMLDTIPDTPYLESRNKSSSSEPCHNSSNSVGGAIIGYAAGTYSTRYHPALYTKHLIKAIQTRKRIIDVFMQVGNNVKQDSGGKQNPYYQSTLKKPYCFGGCRTLGLERGFIAYATQPDQIALDGYGRNSPYTKHLLKFIRQPDLRIKDVFKNVRASVLQETMGIQLPLSEPLLDGGDFYFAGKRDKNVRRVALVIGNADYLHAPLRNPINDAEDMAQALKELGFEVTFKTNVTRQAMQNAISRFGQQLDNRTVGLFYFSGKGLRYSGKDYIMPIDIKGEYKASSQDVVIRQSIAVENVLNTLQTSGSSMNILIIDASRSNLISNK